MAASRSLGNVALRDPARQTLAEWKDGTSQDRTNVIRLLTSASTSIGPRCRQLWSRWSTGAIRSSKPYPARPSNPDRGRRGHGLIAGCSLVSAGYGPGSGGLDG